MDNVNNSESTEIIGFHGTDVESCKNILKQGGSFRSSNKDDEWAGTGIYFFIDREDRKAYHDAYNWSKKIKRVSQDKIKVIEADI